tara:strand:+ start:7462 stop:7626 length:165 start_codon:yes stop_codon:yes gene_type:complete
MLNKINKWRWLVVMLVGITCLTIDYAIIGAGCIIYALAISDDGDDNEVNRIKRP